MAKRDSLMKFLSALYRPINRFVPWHKLPGRPFPRLSLRLWNLPALREDLRRWNLYDTSSLPTVPRPPNYRPGPQCPDPFKQPDPLKPDELYFRRADGSYTDLQAPRMGKHCSRFGRNFPFEESWPNEARLLEPNPRKISNELLARDSFKPAESLNLLAAAWIQFQVHDWARHTPDLDPDKRLRVPLEASDRWPPEQKTPGGEMQIERTLPDPTRPSGCTAGPPTFLADGTFWWDGSQIYGSNSTRQGDLRSRRDGMLTLTTDGRLPPDTNFPGLDLTGFSSGWWAGLSLLHTLFVKEHNKICEELKKTYGWTDDEKLFQTARLINVALIAKIHTVEWTPAILGQPVLKVGMEANWWGVFGKTFRDGFGRISESEALSGIPGSPLDHHSVPYSLTEEFVTVYRMHPLIPDEYRLQSLQDPDVSRHLTFDDIQGQNTRGAIDQIGMENLIYSFGLAHPGAITLGNYPYFLRQYTPPDQPPPPPPNQPKRMFDVATVDILRDRERGVPRYNRFRELLRMPRVKSFEELNPKWAPKLKEIYNDDIDLVDPMVGMHAEELPEGFGFSDTAFRIFILMASRRLKSDRFFTTDYRPEVYTQAGLDWINDNGFERVLRRHYPALARAVHGLANPFHPWQNVH